MQYKSIRKHPQHDENPFVENAIKEIEIRKKTKIQRSTNQSVIQHVVNQEGELTGHTAFLQYIEVDEERFTKLYLSQFAAFWELSKPAIRVFGYIMSVIQPNRDRFIFRMDEALKQTKYTHENSVLTGLSSLVECGIIARTRYDWEYFLNPLVAFNGNRVTFAKTYIKKKKQPDPNQIPIFDEQEEHATVINESLTSKKKSGMKRVEEKPLTDEEKDSNNWSNFTGNPDKPIDMSEERIKQLIEKVLKEKW